MKNRANIAALGLLLVMGLGGILLGSIQLSRWHLPNNPVVAKPQVVQSQIAQPQIIQPQVAQAALSQAPPARRNAVEVAGSYKGVVKLHLTVVGVYSDTLTMPPPPAEGEPEPPDLGTIDLALQISQTNDLLSGYVRLDETMVFSVEHTIQVDETTLEIGPYVNGSFDGTDLTLLSERISTDFNGQSVQRQFWMTGTISTSDGSQLSGQYRETMWGVAPQPVTVMGDFTLQRPVFDIRATESTNSVPLAGNDSATTQPGTAILIDVVANDRDPDGDTLSISIEQAPSNGTAVPEGNKIRYTPNAGFVGDDTFTYILADDEGGAATATVTITVSESAVPNQSPSATEQSVNVTQDTLKSIPLNGSDADEDNLTFSIVDQPSNGTVTIEGSIATYIPNPGFVGQDSFTFKVNDGTVDSEPATVTIQVVSAPGGAASGSLFLPFMPVP